MDSWAWQLGDEELFACPDDDATRAAASPMMVTKTRKPRPTY